jgi:hypothetical protein
MEHSVIVPEEIIQEKIYSFRGLSVMFDRDLAKLYDVETKYLKRQVRRHVNRFPSDFMFELTDDEFQNWRCTFGTSNTDIKMGLRYKPFVFTEQGVAQLSSVLKSPRAIQVNIHIIRLFTNMRRFIMDNELLLRKIELMEGKLKVTNSTIKKVLQYLQSLNSTNGKREKLGYKLPKES